MNQVIAVGAVKLNDQIQFTPLGGVEPLSGKVIGVGMAASLAKTVAPIDSIHATMLQINESLPTESTALQYIVTDNASFPVIGWGSSASWVINDQVTKVVAGEERTITLHGVTSDDVLAALAILKDNGYTASA